MTTLVIPPEIVGDIETLQSRRDAAKDSIVGWARTLIDVPNHHGSTSYCMEQLAAEVERYEHLADEIRRRYAGRWMAHAIQPEETWWR